MMKDIFLNFLELFFLSSTSWKNTWTSQWFTIFIKKIANLYDKEEYVVHIRNLKQALIHGLILKKWHRVMNLNREALVNPYIDMNTELRKNAKKDFEKDFLNLMNNAVFGKALENKEVHRDIKLVLTKHVLYLRWNDHHLSA